MATGYVDPVTYGADPLGIAYSGTALNNAAAAAKTLGQPLIAQGTFLIESGLTIAIKTPCDLSLAEFLVNDATQTVLQIGDRTNDLAEIIYGAEFYLPKITQQGHSTGTWGSDVAVLLGHLNECKVHFRHTVDFTTAVKAAPAYYGMVGCELHLGMMENQKIALHLAPTGDGYVNSNRWLGGRCHINSGEGTAIAGSRHILIDAADNIVNANSFYDTQVEGNGPEYHLECYGQSNNFVNLRWETSGGVKPKVKWSEVDSSHAARFNNIFPGYDAEDIVQTHGTFTSFNNVWARDRMELEGGGVVASRPVIIAIQQGSSSNPAFAAGPAGTHASDILTSYGWQSGQNFTKVKATADTSPRWQVAHASGIHSWGSGSALDLTLQRLGTGPALATDGYFRMGTVSSLPTATVSFRGMAVRVEGAAGVADGWYQCVKTASDTYAWKAVPFFLPNIFTDSAGYTLDLYVGAVSPISCGENLVMQAGGDLVLTSFQVRNDVTVSQCEISVAVQSGNIDLGLYDGGGNRLGSAGLIACPSVGDTTVALTGSVVLTGGNVYYQALFAADGTAAFRGKTGGAFATGSKRYTSQSALPATVNLVSGFSFGTRNFGMFFS